MMRPLFAVAVALLVLAATAAMPVKITSDQFVVDDTQHEATFTGNVVITRATLTLWAAKVLVEYGADGPQSIRTLTATGGVRLKTPTQTATGDTAVYDPKTQILRLSGHVLVSSGTGSIGSADLVIDLKSNLSTFTSGKGGGRVSGVFTPQ